MPASPLPLDQSPAFGRSSQGTPQPPSEEGARTTSRGRRRSTPAPTRALHERSGSAWRNVRQGGLLEVFEEADNRSKQAGGLRFGARFHVASELDVAGELWLQVQEGEFANCWVLASALDGKNINCIKMNDWKRREGRIPRQAVVTFQYAEGYPGSEDTCVISAPGDALWQEIIFETLCRDIASATFFERIGQDCPELDFVSDYAMNCVQFGKLRSPHHKWLVAIVRPSPRWKRFSFEAPSMGLPLETVREDLGPLQLMECEWLWSMRKFLDFDWGSMEFVTSFAFLRIYCHWTLQDCQQLAKEKLFSVLKLCRAEQCAEQCNKHFDAAWWCLEEAFESELMPPPIPETLAEILVYLAATSPPELAWPPSESATEAWSRIEQSMICKQDCKANSLECGLEAIVGTGTMALPRPPSVGVEEFCLCSEGSEDASEVSEDAWDAIDTFNGVSLAECTSPRSSSTNISGSTESAMEEGKSAAVAGVTPDGDASSEPDVAGTGCSANGATIAPYSASQPESCQAKPQDQLLGCGIYVLGGRVGPSGAGEVWRFDSEGHTHSKLPPMSVARCQMAVAVLSGKVYALGGVDVNRGKSPISSVECFDPATGCWSECAPMLQARSHFAAVTLGNCLYAVGGSCNAGSVECFEPVAAEGLGRWTAVSALQSPRCSLSTVLLEGTLYALGGRTSLTSTQALKVVERLEPAVGTWTPVSPMCRTRTGNFACVVRGAIYAVGGCRDLAGNMECYDPAAGTWSILSTISQLRVGGISVAACAGAVYVFQRGHLERVDVDSNGWTRVTSTAQLLVDFGIVGVEPEM